MPNGNLGTRPGDMNLCFKSGGSFEFVSIFKQMLSRLQEHCGECSAAAEHEQLPTYVPPSSSSPDPPTSQNSPVESEIQEERKHEKVDTKRDDEHLEAMPPSYTDF